MGDTTPNHPYLVGVKHSDGESWHTDYARVWAESSTAAARRAVVVVEHAHPGHREFYVSSTTRRAFR